MRERFDLLSQAESYVGQYFSKEYVFRNVLHMSEDEINAMKSQIENEGGGRRRKEMNFNVRYKQRYSKPDRVW